MANPAKLINESKTEAAFWWEAAELLVVKRGNQTDAGFYTAATSCVTVSKLLTRELQFPHLQIKNNKPAVQYYWED